MLGILFVLALSWLILWVHSKEHLTVLGIRPNERHLKEFFLGLTVMALFCAVNLLGQSSLKGISYVRNPDYGFWEAINGIWWAFKAALFE